MKLFKNEVGRPSNETIKKRRIFRIFIIVVAILILGLGGFLVVNSFCSNEILGEGKNATVKKSISFDYSEYGVKVSNGYIRNGMASYQVIFMHDSKIDWKPEKLYYKVTIYKKSSLDQTSFKSSVSSCKSISSGKTLSLATTPKTKEIYANVKLYQDKKCATKELDSANTVHYLYDNVAPTVTKACQKNGYVYVTAKDDYRIKEMAWVSTGTACSKVTTSARTKVNAKSITNKKINQKLLTTQKVKVCIWDLVGNEEAQWVDKNC